MTTSTRISPRILIIAVFLCIGMPDVWAQDTLSQADTNSSASDAEMTIPDVPVNDEDASEGISDMIKQNARQVIYTSAHRYQPISDVSHTSYIITDEDIASHGWRTLAEILRHVPGIHTMTSESQFQTVAIRGMAGIDFNNARILWLIDDVPVNNIHHSGVWLDETWSVDNIRRIEVVMGPDASVYGVGAYQGVVHIMTKTAQDIHKNGEYRIALQDHQTFKAAALYGYAADNGVSVTGHLDFGVTKGPGLIADSLYNNYVMNEAEYSVSHSKQPTFYRKNKLENGSQRVWYDIDLKLNYKDLDFKLSFNDVYANADGTEFNPYIGSLKKIEDRDTTSTSSNAQNAVVDETVKLNHPYQFNRRSLTTAVRYHHAFSSLVDMNALASYRFSQFQHKNYHGLAVSDNAQNDDAYQNYDINEHQLHLSVQTDWHLFKANTLTAGMVLDYHHLSDEMFSKNAKIGYLTPAIYINDEQKLWQNRIILSAGYRFDAWQATKDFSANSSAHVSFVGNWNRWISTRLRYAYATNEPSLQQKYLYFPRITSQTVDQTSDLLGNASFKKENMHDIELSFDIHPLDNLLIQVNGYGKFFDHAVGYYPYAKHIINNEGKTVQVDNRYIQSDDGSIWGAELVLDSMFAQAWRITASYNFVYSKIDTFSQSFLQMNDKDNESLDKQTVQVLKMNYSSIPEDTRHQLKLATTYSNEYINSGLALFVLMDTPKNMSHYSWREHSSYAIPAYAILQPHISVALPANFGMMVQGSYAFSKGMADSPTYRYYYEREGVPVSRYSVMLSLMYPFKKSE